MTFNPAMYESAVELSFVIGMMISALLFYSVLKVKRKNRVSFIGLFGMGAAVCICLGASGNVHTIPLTAYIQETIAPAH